MRRTLLDDEHELFRDSVRRFIATEVVPDNERWEREGIVDRSLFTRAGAHGFLGMAAAAHSSNLRRGRGQPLGFSRTGQPSRRFH